MDKWALGLLLGATLSLLSIPVCAEPMVDGVIELGGGELVYAGAQYHLPAWPWSPLETVGVLCGYTFLNEAAVHVIEPTLYVSGPLFRDLIWRARAGKMLVVSYEYSASGNVWTLGADVLWAFTPWSYVELSLPVVMGEQGSEWTPCLGVGFKWPLVKTTQP
jgi:hypothetical protein